MSKNANARVVVRRPDALAAIEAYRRAVEPIPAAGQAAADLIVLGAKVKSWRPKSKRT